MRSALSSVHIVGVGGAGMSGLATLLAESGALVSGSDAVDSPVLARLAAHGVRVHVGHDAAHGVGASIVTWSPAVDASHPEVAAAVASGAVALSRAEMLARLGDERRVIGLTGTHGKTTATSMMVHVMAAARRDCARLVGADVIGVGENGHWGEDDLILEVDESYGTFALLHPFALGVLNIEADHLDHYGSLEVLERAFKDLMARTAGPLVAWTSDPGVARVRANLSREVVGVGTSKDASWRVEDVRLDRSASSFTLRHDDEEFAVRLQVTGAHNVANAAVVAVLAREVGVELEHVVAGLAHFTGAPRRFQRRGSWRGVDVYEDYAHLPGEIAATIAGARAAGYERVAVVFQPHRVTRTLNLLEDFARSFDDVAHLAVTDVYRAGEPNPTGVTGEHLVRAIAGHDPSAPVVYCASLDEVADAVEPWHDEIDVLLFLGAGDVARSVTTLHGMVAP